MPIFTIPIEIIEIDKGNYHVFLNLQINKIICRLLLDTGASKTVMDTERVHSFLEIKDSVQSHHTKSVGLGVSELETQIATLRRWKMNQFKLRKFEVAILPIAHVNETYHTINLPPIDGVLGSDFLVKYNAIINYKKQVLKLEKKT
jgi:hypothetical protein